MAPIWEKMGCGGEPELLGRELPASARVAASEASLCGTFNEGCATALAREPALDSKSTPGRVAASGLSAGLGVGAELSPLDTATPSGARRAAPSKSDANSPYLPQGRAQEGAVPLEPAYLESIPLIACLAATFHTVYRAQMRADTPARKPPPLPPEGGQPGVIVNSCGSVRLQ